MRLRRARRLLIQVAKDYGLTAVMLALWAAVGFLLNAYSIEIGRFVEALLK